MSDHLHELMELLESVGATMTLNGKPVREDEVRAFATVRADERIAAALCEPQQFAERGLLVQEAYRMRANAGNEQVKRRDEYIAELEKRVDDLVAENAALIKRRGELLALVARISQETPLASEIEGWEGQRARLLAEVGTLRSVIRDLSGPR